MNDCNGLFGHWFGHRLRPCYDSAPATPIPEIMNGFDRISRGALEMILEKNEARNYVCHVCTRCGQKEMR